MAVLRSFVCQFLFYANFLCFGILAPFVIPLPKAWVFRYAVIWKHLTMFLWRVTTNSSIEIRGRENLPKGGCIIASKHQSTWETLAFGTIVDRVVFIMKQELLYLPVFGWFTWRTGMIPIQRKKKGKVFENMALRAQQSVEKGHQLVIFMEGTRVQAGEMGTYKTGVARLYQSLDCPIVPVALNAGLLWPKNSFWRHSGKVVVEFLPPIMPGKSIDEVMTILKRDIEEASNRLLLESANSPNPPPTMAAALTRLKKRGVDISAVSQKSR